MGLDTRTVSEVADAFTAGEYSVYRGTLNVRFGESPAIYAVPFLTVLRRDNEAHASHRGPLLAAHTGGDLAAQAELLAPDVWFQDPTAQVFGPGSGRLFESPDQLLARRRQIYEQIGAFAFDAEGSFATNHHAVYPGGVLSSGVKPGGGPVS